MMYKKSLLGRKYMRLMTGSPWIFTSFVLLGVFLFLFLTLSTKIDVIRTYSAKTRLLESEMLLSVNDANISVGPAFLYSNKNSAVYSVWIEKTENTAAEFFLYFNSDGQDIIKNLSTESLFIDIPQGKETLLYRIFVKGGKGRE